MRNSTLKASLTGVLVAVVGGIWLQTSRSSGPTEFDDGRSPDPSPRASALTADSRPVLPQAGLTVRSAPVSAERNEAGELSLPTWVLACHLEGEDATRLARINAALSNGGMTPIERDRKILPNDLLILRVVVDEAEKRVARAEDDFLDACTEATAQPCKDLMARIDRNELVGLPLLGPDNPFRRNHPHEAITQVLHGGRCYVVRVGPWMHQGLAKAGAAYDAAAERRRSEYSTMVLPLFR